MRTKANRGTLLFAALATLLAWTGCQALRDAREAQEELEPKGRVENSVNSGLPYEIKDVSLPSLVEFALTNRPSLRASALAVKDARLALKELDASAPLVSETPWTSFSISASGGYDASSGAAPLRDLKWDTEGSASAALSLDILAYDFGRYNAKAREQSEKIVAAELAFIADSYTVFEEVTECFFTLLEKDALLEVALTNQIEFASHLRQAKENLAAGEGKKYDVMRATYNYTDACEKTVNASNDVSNAGAEMLRALGIVVSRGDREKIVWHMRNPLREMRRAFAPTEVTTATVFEFARTNSPTLQVERAYLRAASAAVDAARADLYPEISLNASLNWSDPLWYWKWGVSAAQDLFAGFRKTAALERATVALRKADADLDVAEQKLSLDIALAIAERDNARNSFETAKASVMQARENLDMANEQFRIGELDTVDYNTAVNDYTTSLGNRVTAFYRGQIAEAKLFALAGLKPRYALGYVYEEDIK